MDLWNLRVTELCRDFQVRCRGIYALQISRSGGEAMCIEGVCRRLLYYRSDGDNEWVANKDLAGSWHDVILYGGLFCAVDEGGRTLLFESSSSFAATEIAPPMADFVKKLSTKRLVESCGELFVVGIKWKKKQGKVYRLNREERAWIEVTSLGNRIFFIAESGGCSFSVWAKEFAGNCVYFNMVQEGIAEDEREVFCGGKTTVYEVETGRLGRITAFPEHLQIFWPPPKWIEQPTLLKLLLLRTLI